METKYYASPELESSANYSCCNKDPLRRSLRRSSGNAPIVVGRPESLRVAAKVSMNSVRFFHVHYFSSAVESFVIDETAFCGLSGCVSIWTLGVGLTAKEAFTHRASCTVVVPRVISTTLAHLSLLFNPLFVLSLLCANQIWIIRGHFVDWDEIKLRGADRGERGRLAMTFFIVLFDGGIPM